MSEEAVVVSISLHVNQDVQTPNGPGVIWGRMVDGGQTRILIAHDPKSLDALAPGVVEVLKHYRGGPCVLWKYPIKQITPIK